MAFYAGREKKEAQDSLTKAYDRYGAMLYRICFASLGQAADAQDAVQETFLRFFTHKKFFESDEHQKAWLIRVAVNRCRDVHRSKKARAAVSLEDIALYGFLPPEEHLLEQIGALPQKYKTVLILHYLEGYSVQELCGLLHMGQSAVKMRLLRAREALRERLEKDGEQ